MQALDDRLRVINNNYAKQMTDKTQDNNIQRPEIPEEITPAEYFEEFIFDRVNLCPLPKIKSLNTIIRFDIGGEDAGSWTISVERGLLNRVQNNNSGICSLSNEPVLVPVSTFCMDSETFVSILKREITPQQAFFKRRVEIKGDIFIALKMNVLVQYL